MGAQLRSLEEKEQESALTIDGLQRQGRKKDHEIDRLKSECANLTRRADRASKVPKLDSDSRLQEMSAQIAQLEANYSKQAETTRKIKEDFSAVQSEARKWREAAHKHTANLSEFRSKEKIGLAQLGQAIKERDQAVEEASRLQALVVHHEAKMQEAQRYSDAMSKAVHEQAQVLNRHVREAEEELHRNANPPVGFFRLFRFCKDVLRGLM